MRSSECVTVAAPTAPRWRCRERTVDVKCEPVIVGEVERMVGESEHRRYVIDGPQLLLERRTSTTACLEPLAQIPGLGIAHCQDSRREDSNSRKGKEAQTG